MQLDVRLNVSSMLAIKREGERGVRLSAARAINRAIDTSKTTAGREISRLTKIKVREVTRRLSVSGATPDRLIATLEAHPYSPNLGKFNATQNAIGVAASAWERRKTYHHAFKLKGQNRVVTRTTNKRFPLKGLRGPSVRTTFLRPAVLSTIEQAARSRFVPEFEREIARRLGT